MVGIDRKYHKSHRENPDPLVHALVKVHKCDILIRNMQFTIPTNMLLVGIFHSSLNDFLPLMDLVSKRSVVIPSSSKSTIHNF